VNLLVVGASHHAAPVELLERLSVSTDRTPDLLRQLVSSSYVDQAVVLSTCNRVEVYAAVSAFHGGLSDIGGVLAGRAGMAVGDLTPHLSVRFETDAVRHVLRVAAGLDSMVVGEAQILGQLRDAYAIAAEHDTTGRLLHELMQQALRVGKRIHSETGIDRAGQSVVSAALALVPGGPPPTPEAPLDLAGRSALVVGAGSMGGLALATLARAGAAPLLVTSRRTESAARAAELHGATAVPWDVLGQHLSTVDIVVTVTASPTPVLDADLVGLALRARPGTPLSIVDLAVPRDVEPSVASLPGISLIDLDTIARASLTAPSVADREAAEAIVAAEVEGFRAWLRGADAAPTVAALRARADEVVGVELRRLWHRRPDLSEDQRADFARTVHRVVQRLLHQPTVRLRELASSPDGDLYLALLREIFGELESHTYDGDLSVPDLPGPDGEVTR
jgi:glutamyl-tRNA reductase